MIITKKIIKILKVSFHLDKMISVKPYSVSHDIDELVMENA